MCQIPLTPLDQKIKMPNGHRIDIYHNSESNVVLTDIAINITLMEYKYNSLVILKNCFDFQPFDVKYFVVCICI